jgi:hypothetical protein
LPGFFKPAKIKLMLWFLLALLSASEWLQTGIDGFEISFRPGMERYAEMIKSEAPGAKKLIDQNLGFDFKETVRIVITESDSDFQAVQSGVPEWAAATAQPERNSLFLKPLKNSGAENLAVTFRHELAHILIYHRLSGRSGPRWFEEGMAVLCSGEFEYTRFQVLAQIGLTGSHIPFRELDQGFPDSAQDAQTAYLESESFVAYLMDRLGRDGFDKFLDRVGSGEDFYQALERCSGLSFAELESGWAHKIRYRYGLAAVLGGSGTLWFLVTLLFLFAYIVKRLKTADKKARLELATGDDEDDDYVDTEDGPDQGGDVTWH